MEMIIIKRQTQFLCAFLVALCIVAALLFASLWVTQKAIEAIAKDSDPGLEIIITEPVQKPIQLVMEPQAYVYTPVIYDVMHKRGDAYDCDIETEDEVDAEPVPVHLDIPLSPELQDYTMELSAEFGICYDLVFAMMFVESTFRDYIVSRTNDYGLMQINRVNHGWLRVDYGITDFLCARQNIFAGILMISRLYETYEDLHMALMAYNMGQAGARRRWNQGFFTSTYSERVIRIMNDYIQERQYIKLNR